MLVVSNRAIKEKEAPAGGLGVALRATLEASGGHWFCIVGDDTATDCFRTEEKWSSGKVTVHTIHVPKAAYEAYYAYANKLAWTNNHDRPDLSRFTHAEQKAYAWVLDSVADEITAFMKSNGLRDETVWVHDFHLSGLGQRLKDLFQLNNIQGKLLFHLHTPLAGMRVAIMSARDVFKETGKIFSGENLSKTFNRVATITWLKQHKPDNAKAYLDFVKDLTYYDSVTFHTEAFCRNFVQLLGIKPHTGMKFPRFGERTLSYEGRSFKVMNAPISIMANKILEKIREKLKENEGDEDKDIRVKKKWTKVKNALQPDVQDLLGQMYDKVEYIIYSGAERGDFSKGIPERARQYYQYLKDNPDMWGRVQLFQIMIPTRENLDEGDNEYLEVVKEAMYWFDKAAEDFKVEGWKPVILRDKKIDNDDAILLARALRFMGGELRHLICMAGALRDGLNLTVGETVIAQDKIYPGLIVVPEKIGAAQELGAFTWTYNPEDEGAFAGVMKRAIALYERKDCIEILREMHRNMKNYLLKNDLMNWAINCIRTVSDSAADELEVQNHKQKFAKLYKKSKESGYYTRKLAGSLDSEGTQVESCNRPSLTPS